MNQICEYDSRLCWPDTRYCSVVHLSQTRKKPALGWHLHFRQKSQMQLTRQQFEGLLLTELLFAQCIVNCKRIGRPLLTNPATLVEIIMKWTACPALVCKLAIYSTLLSYSTFNVNMHVKYVWNMVIGDLYLINILWQLSYDSRAHVTPSGRQYIMYRDFEMWHLKA